MQLYSRKHYIKDLVFDTIYLGGGTPSLVPPKFICSILDDTLGMFHFKSRDSLEVSMECNPDSVSQELMEAVKERGVNRVSLGVQSMDDGELQFLGRIHDRNRVISAVDTLRRAGIENLSVDVIYCLPGQDREGVISGLKEILSLGPKHFSCYELTLEKGTPLEESAAKGTFKLPCQEERLELTMAVESFLEKRGYGQYEISNFSMPGFECRHNMGYWTGEEYLGLGCSACSYLEGKRTKNTPVLEDYLGLLEEGNLPICYAEELDQKARFREAFVMALRMNRGILITEFSEKYGVDILDYYGRLLGRMKDYGLIRFYNENKALALTPRGRYISNYVLSHFV